MHHSNASMNLIRCEGVILGERRRGRCIELTAEDVTNAMSRGGMHDWSRHYVSSDLNLAGLTVEKPVRIRGALFSGIVDLSQARFKGGVDLTGCQFGQRLVFKDACIRGPLVLDHSVIGSEVEEAANLPIVADFDHVRVAGCLSMVGVSVLGGFSCCHAKIENDFRIDGATIKKDFDLRQTFLGELRTDWKKVSVDKRADSVDDQPCRIGGNVNLTSSTVSGDLRLIGVTIGGELNLQAADIGGNLLCRANEKAAARLMRGAWLMFVRVKGSADFSGACFEGNLMLENACVGGTLLLRAVSFQPGSFRCEITHKAWLLGIDVGGDVDMSGIRIGDDLVMQNASIGKNIAAKVMGGFSASVGGDVYLGSSRIRGSVEFAGSLLDGELELDRASIDGGLVVAFDFDDADDWKLVRSQVSGKIHAESTIIGKRLVFMGVNVESQDYNDKLKIQESAVSFVGAQISGELSFYSRKLVQETLQSKKAAYQAQDLSADREAEVLSCALRERTRIRGNLRLARAQILGDISLDGVQVEGELDLRDAIVRSNIDCRPIRLGPCEEPVRALVYRADFETLDMTGDVSLTGLTIAGSQKDEVDGDLILRDARIRGRLELYPFPEAEDLAEGAVCCKEIAVIHGSLRLDAATISHVVLSGKTFEGDCLLQVEHASEGGPGKASRRVVNIVLERGVIGRLQIIRPLPGTLDLSNLKVDRWDLPEDRSSYRNMLERSYPFKKSNYIAIENTLSNAGEDELADEVHVWMRRRDRRSTKSFWKFLLESFLDGSIRYGTTSRRLVFFMILLFAASVWLFRDPSRVEYDIQPTAQDPLPTRHPVDWSISDAALFSVPLHVPIISLGVKQEVQPSGSAMKAYAMAVVAANWVMWPLLIANASGFIRKRS